MRNNDLNVTAIHKGLTDQDKHTFALLFLLSMRWLAPKTLRWLTFGLRGIGLSDLENDWELDTIQQFLLMVGQRTFNHSFNDKINRRLFASGLYSVKSCFGLKGIALRGPLL